MIATIVALPLAVAKGLEAALCGYQRTRLILDCYRDTIRKGNAVADRAETTITLTDAPHDDERAVTAEGLRAYNEAQAGYSDSRALAVLVRDPETKNVVGGLHGRTSLGLLRVELFFLPEDLRRGRLGSRILAMAEEEGRRRGCTRAVLSTLHFQAPGFYLKQGWEVAARIECEPPGHTRFYMTKKL
jgi:GNAT superfamily N-acetyltransferase